MPRLCLILFGPPGSGKGTQAKLIHACLGLPHISTGDILRSRVQAGDSLGREVAGLMAAGQLVPDSMVNRLVEDRIALPDCEPGFILDGYPRTVPQAEILSATLRTQSVVPVVVHLKVDYNEIIARLSGRRQCPNCGSLFNLVSNPPSREGLCDNCGGTLAVRPDDRVEVIRGRLDAYDRQTAPVLEFFRRDGLACQDVSGDGDTPQAISSRICSLLPRAGAAN